MLPTALVEKRSRTKIYPIDNKNNNNNKIKRRRVRSQSLSLQTSPSRGKARERRQFLVKAEIQSPFAASAPVEPAVRQEGLLSGGRRRRRTGRKSYRSRCPQTGRCSGLEEAEWPGLSRGSRPSHLAG